MNGIYMIKNLINDNIYIGQSIYVEERLKKHIRDSRNKNRKNYNYPLYRAFRKYGVDNFSLILLEEVLDKNKNTSREQYWYEKLKPQYNQIEPRDYTNTGIEVLQIDKKTLRVVKIHKSMASASKSLGLTASAISNILNPKKRNRSTKDFYWCKKDQYKEYNFIDGGKVYA